MIDERDMFGLPEGDAQREQLLDQAEDPSGKKWPKTLAEYVQVLEALYKRKGMTAEQAFRLAADSVLELAEQRGGRVEYLPSGDRLRTALKHAEIFRRAKAGNYEELALQFDILPHQVYRIVREQKALHLAKIQGSLF